MAPLSDTLLKTLRDDYGITSFTTLSRQGNTIKGQGRDSCS